MPIISTVPLLIVGAGNMGGALIKGWLAGGLDPRLLTVVDPAPPEALRSLLAAGGARCVPDISAGGLAFGAIVLAVKPQMMDAVLGNLVPVAAVDTVLLSVAAGRTVASLARHFPHPMAIVRSIPNTPASVGRGMTAAFANGATSPAQRDLCQALLGAVGNVAWVAHEPLIDAATAVSGSGPAYVFLLAECLATAGRAAGLPEDLAAQLARATVTGAGELLWQSDLAPAVLRQNVTSPQGTTAAALEVLMSADGLQALLTRAVAAAKARAVELSA